MKLTKVQVNELVYIYYMSEIFGGATAVVCDSEDLRFLIGTHLVQYVETNPTKVFVTPEGRKLVRENYTQEALKSILSLTGWVGAGGDILKTLFFNLPLEHFPQFLVHNDKETRKQAGEVYKFRTLAKAMGEVAKELTQCQSLTGTS